MARSTTQRNESGHLFVTFQITNSSFLKVRNNVILKHHCIIIYKLSYILHDYVEGSFQETMTEFLSNGPWFEMNKSYQLLFHVTSGNSLKKGNLI